MSSHIEFVLRDFYTDSSGRTYPYRELSVDPTLGEGSVDISLLNTDPDESDYLVTITLNAVQREMLAEFLKLNPWEKEYLK